MTVTISSSTVADFTLSDARVDRLLDATSLEEAQHMGIVDRLIDTIFGGGKREAIGEAFEAIRRNDGTRSDADTRKLSRFEALKEQALPEHADKFKASVDIDQTKGQWNYAFSIDNTRIFKSEARNIGSGHALASYQEALLWPKVELALKGYEGNDLAADLAKLKVQFAANNNAASSIPNAHIDIAQKFTHIAEFLKEKGIESNIDLHCVYDAYGRAAPKVNYEFAINNSSVFSNETGDRDSGDTLATIQDAMLWSKVDKALENHPAHDRLMNSLASDKGKFSPYSHEGYSLRQSEIVMLEVFAQLAEFLEKSGIDTYWLVKHDDDGENGKWGYELSINNTSIFKSQMRDIGSEQSFEDYGRFISTFNLENSYRARPVDTRSMNFPGELTSRLDESNFAANILDAGFSVLQRAGQIGANLQEKVAIAASHINTLINPSVGRWASGLDGNEGVFNGGARDIESWRTLAAEQDTMLWLNVEKVLETHPIRDVLMFALRPLKEQFAAENKNASIIPGSSFHLTHRFTQIADQFRTFGVEAGFRVSPDLDVASGNWNYELLIENVSIFKSETRDLNSWKMFIGNQDAMLLSKVNEVLQRHPDSTALMQGLDSLKNQFVVQNNATSHPLDAQVDIAQKFSQIAKYLFDNNVHAGISIGKSSDSKGELIHNFTMQIGGQEIYVGMIGKHPFDAVTNVQGPGSTGGGPLPSLQDLNVVAPFTLITIAAMDVELHGRLQPQKASLENRTRFVENRLHSMADPFIGTSSLSAALDDRAYSNKTYTGNKPNSATSARNTFVAAFGDHELVFSDEPSGNGEFRGQLLKENLKRSTYGTLRELIQAAHLTKDDNELQFASMTAYANFYLSAVDSMSALEREQVRHALHHYPLYGTTLGELHRVPQPERLPMQDVAVEAKAASSMGRFWA